MVYCIFVMPQSLVFICPKYTARHAGMPSVLIVTTTMLTTLMPTLGQVSLCYSIVWSLTSCRMAMEYLYNRIRLEWTEEAREEMYTIHTVVKK